MRAIWTGSISFGLVNVPVKLYGATESHDLEFHQVHDEDGGRIRYERRCEKCGEVVEYAHIDKAYDDGERTVVLEDEDFEALPAAVKDEIEVVRFCPSAQVDPIRLEKAYYLEPQGKSSKSYRLLRETLKTTELTAIARFSLREKTRLGVLRAHDDVIVLQGLLWGDEVRAAEFEGLGGNSGVTKQELELSSALVEQLSGDFDPEEFADDYQEQLRELVDAKLAKGDAVDTAETFGEQPEQEGEGAEVLDLMEALRRSLAASDGAKGGGAGRGLSPAKTRAAGASDAPKRSPAKADAETDAAKERAAKSPAAAKKSTGKRSTTKKLAAAEKVDGKPAASRSKRSA